MKKVKLKEERQRILVVGCGGVGSYLIREIHRLIMSNQIDLDKTDIVITDFDDVELKNIKYQDFTIEEIGKNKAEVLSDRYFLNHLKEKITSSEQLNDYNFIVCCVDNSQARKLIFEYCFKNDKYFIDLRAEARAIALFTKDGQTKESILKTIDVKDKESRSCQLAYELENNIIQNGNLIVGSIASQLILNKLRKEKNQKEYRYYI